MASPRQPFTPCKLYIDGADGLSAGDYIVTSGGSAYLVQATRPSPLHKGQHRQGVAAVNQPEAFAGLIQGEFLAGEGFHSDGNTVGLAAPRNRQQPAQIWVFNTAEGHLHGFTQTRVAFRQANFKRLAMSSLVGIQVLVCHRAKVQCHALTPRRNHTRFCHQGAV